MPSSNALYDIFFIYHPDDIAFVRHLAAQLSAREISCRVDEADFGADQRALRDGILRSHTVALALTPASASSQLCSSLVEFTIANSKRFVSLIADENIESDVHPAIAASPYILFRQDDAFEVRLATLLGLLQADSHLRLHTDMLVQAHSWERQERPDALLLSPERAEQARQWLADGAQRSPKPSQLQVEYIHASRRQKPAARKPRARFGLLGAFAIIVILALIALLQNTGVNRAAATATAQFLSLGAAETQQSQEQAAAATAQSDDSARLLARVHATSAVIAGEIRRTALAAAHQATALVSLAQTAQARNTRQAADQRATETARINLDAAALQLLGHAEAALSSGDIDLALALAWDAAHALRSPVAALPALRRITTLAPDLSFAEVASLKASSTGGRFALIMRDRLRARVFDAEDLTLAYEIDDHEGELTTLDFSPDGSYLVTAAGDGAVVIREGATGDPLWQLGRHQAAITAIAISHGGEKLYTAGGDGLLIAWELETGAELASAKLESNAAGARKLLLTSEDSRLIVWADIDGQPVMSQYAADTLEMLTADTGGRVYRGHDPLGSIAYTGGRSLPAYPGDPNTGPLTFWDMNTGQEISRLGDGFNWSPLGGDGIAAADDLLLAAFDGTEALIVVADSQDRQRAHLVSVMDGGNLRRFPGQLAESLTSAQFIQPGIALSATGDGRLILWSAADGSLIQELGMAADPLQRVTVDAAGDYALAHAADGSAYAWRIDRDALQWTQTLENATPGTALDASGAALLLTGESGVRLIDIPSGGDLPPGDDIRLARMNPPGGHVALYHGDTISVHAAATGERLSTWTVDLDDVSDMALAPAGDALIALTATDELHWLQAGVDSPRQLDKGSLGGPVLIKFAPDGQRMLTLHAGQALLWDEGRATALPLGLPADFPLSERVRAAFSAGGEKLVFAVLLDNSLATLTEIDLRDASLRRGAYLDVAHAELSADGTLLFLAHLDGSIAIISSESGETIATLASQGPPARALHYQAASGKLYAADDENLLVWDVSESALVNRYALPQPISAISVSQASHVALTIDAQGRYRLWPMESADGLLRRIQADFMPRDLSCAERERYRALPLCA